MRPTTLFLLALIAIVTAVSGLAGAALAQEAPKYEDLKRMYDGAVQSLKAAHDAKLDLANKNEDLKKQVEALQKQLSETARDRDELARQCANHAERTYQLRAAHAAWQEFVKRYPSLHARWKAFLETELLRPGNDPPALAEPDWPFQLQG
jgi:septal ring factor EnvC (AmiA/AmiB activator)